MIKRVAKMRAPKKPTSLTASGLTMSSVLLTWRDNSINESGFEIQRCQGASCTIFTKIATVPVNTTQYTDNNLSSGTTYCYRVRAFNSGGNSGFTNIASVTTPQVVPPPNPVPTLTITCPVNITVNSPDGNPVTVTLQNSTTTGGIAPITFVYSVSGVPISLSHAFSVGMTTVNVAATSSDGQTASCNFIVNVTNIVITPGAKRQIAFKDLNWVGAFISPAALGSNGGALSYPFFTTRRVNGVLRTMWLTPGFGGFGPHYDLIETDFPGYNQDLTQAPIANNNLRNFGNGFLPLCLGFDGNPINNLYMSGINWDNRNNCLWVSYYDVYNVSINNDSVLIRGDFTDSNPDASVVAWSGPWRLTGSAPNTPSVPNSHQVQSYVVSVPSTYGGTYLGGATIALGGGYSSGGGNSPYNNVLWAPTVTPNSGTTPFPGGADLNATCLIGGDIQLAHRGRRPGDYTTQFCNPPAGQGDTDPTVYDRHQLSGYWGAFDSVGAAVWIDWDTVKGLLFFVSHGRGHIWYNNAGLHPPPPGYCAHGVADRYSVTGPESVIPVGVDSLGNPYPSNLIHNPPLAYETGPDIESALYIYDPNTLVPVVGGDIWQPAPTEVGYMLDKFPQFAVSKNLGGYCVIKPNGMSTDQTARLIMIPCGYVTGGLSNVGFYVNVFSVAP